MTGCPKHPGAEAVGTCTRCGRFFCAAEAKRLGTGVYCEECAMRAEVDWLGKHYAQFQGRRSGLVWFLLLLGVPLSGIGVTIAVTPSSGTPERFFGLALMTWGAACISLFPGKTPVRWVPLLAAFVVGGLVYLATQRELAAVLTASCLILFSVMTLTDLRTRLFFRVPVTRQALEQHYARYGNNPLAVAASRLAFVGLVIPGAGVLAIVLAAVALSRVNGKAVPPVGSAGTAITAIVFSLFTSLLWFRWLGAK